MKLRKEACVLFLGTYLLSACGGGSGSPKVSFSPSSLSFSEQVLPSSETQLIVLTNSGTASLNIANIAVPTDFTQTNDCGPTLTPGTSCDINVTFTPPNSSSLNISGDLSVTDNAPGSPQIAPLSGMLTPGTLNGLCFGGTGGQPECYEAWDKAQCTVGQPAIDAGGAGCLGSNQIVDAGSKCSVKSNYGLIIGWCEVVGPGASASGKAGIESGGLRVSRARHPRRQLTEVADRCADARDR